MHPLIVRRVLFPLHEWLLGRPTLRALRELEEVQWWPPERIREYQVRKLRELLRHARERVPFWRRRLAEAGVDPERAEPEDLRRLPLLDKAQVREHFHEMVARGAPRRDLIRMNTGGSTGRPLIFYVDRRRVAYDRAAHLRARRWWGIEIGEPEAVVWGSPIELAAQDRLKALRDRLFNTRLLSAFRMGPAEMDRYLRFLRRFRPRHVFGYPSSIELLCRFARKRGVSLDDLGVRAVFVTAEVLLEPQRRAISEAFGCPVANGYGGRDGGFIAHECPAGGMHLTEDILVEVVDREGNPCRPGQEGEVVVTHLDNHVMPLIRYRMGDVSSLLPGRCPCGRGSALLGPVRGRTTDMVVTPGGQVMHALSLIYVVRDLPGIEAFRIVQEAVDRLTVELVPAAGFGPEVAERLVQGLRRAMGAPVEVRLRLRPEIPPEASGKHRYVVSRVAPPA